MCDVIHGQPQIFILQVSGCEDIKNAMLLLEVHARDGDESEKTQLANMAKAIPKFHALRSIGNPIV